MNIKGMLSELKAERNRLEKAILSLERLSRGEVSAAKRGRSPKWLKDLAEENGMPKAAAQAAGKK